MPAKPPRHLQPNHTPPPTPRPGRLRRWWRAVDEFLRAMWDAMGRYPRVPKL